MAKELIKICEYAPRINLFTVVFSNFIIIIF